MEQRVLDQNEAVRLERCDLLEHRAELVNRLNIEASESNSQGPSAVSIAPFHTVFPGLAGLNRPAKSRASGNISRSRARRFPIISSPMIDRPVALPPGCERLPATPVATGSPAPAMTIETRVVTSRIERTAVVPVVTMSFTSRLSSSAASTGS